MKYCINCGNKMETEMRFCPACGYDSEKNKLSDKEETAEKSETENIAKEEPIDKQPSKITTVEEKTADENTINSDTVETETYAPQNSNAQDSQKTTKKQSKKASKKKVFIIAGVILAILVLAVVLPKMFKEKPNENPTHTYIAADSFSNTPETTTAERINTEECLSAYETYLNNYIDENRDSIDSDGAFSLVYIDNDDIPELVIGAQHFHAAGAELCVYNGSSVKSLGNYGQYGQMVYFPKKNVFFNHYSGMGGTNTTVYNLENCAAKEIQNFKEEPLDIASEEFRYYIDDKEVSREEYKKSYSQVVPENPIQTPDLSASDSYPLSKDGIRQCFRSSEESTTKSGRESYTARENVFNSQDKSLAYLADIGYANKVAEMFGDNYTIDYFYHGNISHSSTGNFAEERIVYYPDTDEYGTIGLIIYRFGGDGEKVTDDDFINGAMHNGKDTVAIDTDLNSDITYGELKDRFGATAEKDSNTGIYVATIEYRGNDIHFAYNDMPSDSDTAYECWLQPHV